MYAIFKYSFTSILILKSANRAAAQSVNISEYIMRPRSKSQLPAYPDLNASYTTKLGLFERGKALPH